MRATLNQWEYRMSDSSWGKYDSGFHAWLVEACDPDDWFGDTDWGGASLYGRRVDYWDTQGFHTLCTYDTEALAEEAYRVAEGEFYRWEDAED